MCSSSNQNTVYNIFVERIGRKTVVGRHSVAGKTEGKDGVKGRRIGTKKRKEKIVEEVEEGEE